MRIAELCTRFHYPVMPGQAAWLVIGDPVRFRLCVNVMFVSAAVGVLSWVLPAGAATVTES